MLKYKKISEGVFKGMTNLIFEQDKANIDKNIWVKYIECLHEFFSDYVLLADIRPLYGVNNLEKMVETNRIFFMKDLKRDIYLFSIENRQEINEITRIYCEDFSLSFIFLKKDEKRNYNDYSEFFNFAFLPEDRFSELIVKADLYVTFGDIAQYMGITCQNKFTEHIVHLLGG